MALGAIKVNGDSTAVAGFDIEGNADNAARVATGIIATGLGGHPTAYKITSITGFAASNLTVESGINRSNGNIGLVARILDVIQLRNTVAMYQVESASGQLSVLVENSAWTDAELQAYIRANIGAAQGVYGNSSTTTTTVSSVNGFKLA
jgi:hypothetical protein